MGDEHSPLLDVQLTHDELLALDGRCRPELQQLIDDSRRVQQTIAALSSHLSATTLRIVAHSVALALRDGRVGSGCLREHIVGGQTAWCCGASPGFEPYRVRGAHGEVGDPNRKKPRQLEVLRLDQQTPICLACLQPALPTLREALADLVAFVDKRIDPTRRPLLRYAGLACRHCGWRGHWKADRQHITRRHRLRCPDCGLVGADNVNRHHGHGFVICDGERVVRDGRTAAPISPPANADATELAIEAANSVVSRDPVVRAATLGVSPAALLLDA